jgi:hypothetical protein
MTRASARRLSRYLAATGQPAQARRCHGAGRAFWIVQVLA